MQKEWHQTLDIIYQSIEQLRKEQQGLKNDLQKHIAKDKIDHTGMHLTETSMVNSLEGREIYCPKCMKPSTVYHLDWSSEKCQNPDCKEYIEKTDWLIK